MLNGEKYSARSLQQFKIESGDDIDRQELEEDKANTLKDFNMRSPHIQKKRMDFGHGL